MVAEAIPTCPPVPAVASVRVSASGLDRALACVASVVLPQERSTSEASERGTAIHAYLAAVLRGLPVMGLLEGMPSDWQWTCEAIDASEIVREDETVLLTEHSFVVNALTGEVRELGADRDRDYGVLARGEIPGTLDLVVGQADGSIRCEDFKSGQPCTRADRNMQMRFAALCVAWKYGVDEVTVVLRYVHEDGSTHVDVATLDAIDLDQTRDVLRAAWLRWEHAASEAMPATAPGEHCHHCNAKGHCPVYGRELDVLAIAHKGWLPTLAQGMDDDDFARAWRVKLGIARDVIELAEKALNERIKRRALPLLNGTAVKQSQTRRQHIQGDKARKILREAFDPKVVESACETRVTKKALRQAFGKDTDKVLAVLQQHGAVSEVITESPRVVKASG